MSLEQVQYNPCNDYYRRLGVHSHATQEEILHAYRKAVKKHHPDVGGEPTGREIKAIYEAYTRAMKSGNPNALVAYNTGPIGWSPEPKKPATSHEDYLGGEVNWRTYEMDIPAFLSSEGVHTLRIRAAYGVSNADSFGIGFGWSPPKREKIFADDFDQYATMEEVLARGWRITNGSGYPEGAWRLWNTAGAFLAEGETGPDFPGFFSGYVVSNGDFAGAVQLDEELISPEIDCARYVCVTAQFLSAINIYETDPDHDLQTTDFDISFYQEASQSWSGWVNLFTHDRTGGDDFSAIPKWFDVSSLADGKNVKLRWRFYNTNNDYWWAIDDVRVSGEKRPPRVLSPILQPGGTVTLSWESFGQGLYTVELCDDILKGEWQPVSGTDWPIAETTWQGDDVSKTDSRFYRVRSE